jgi:hypothetical protein
MVLISIIVGLSIGHVMLGVGGIIDRRTAGPPLKLSLAHGTWLGFVFLWSIQFWWWEFRFSEIVSEWTLGLYLFLVAYALALFLMSVILVPRSWDGVSDLNEHFMQRRIWFYWAFAGTNVIDVFDGLLKGGAAYIEGLGPSIWLLWFVSLGAVVVGLRSKTLRHHEVAAGALFVSQIAQQFNDVPSLGF